MTLVVAVVLALTGDDDDPVSGAHPGRAARPEANGTLAPLTGSGATGTARIEAAAWS